MKYTKRNLKNLLVQYKGGGYDGCFWEWNYFLFDANGKFHVIAASGHRGIATREAAINLLNIGERKHYSTDEPYTYRLTDKSEVKSFQADCAPQHVAGVVGKVNEIYGKPVMFWECQECSRKQHDSEMFHDGYHGNGGIGVQMDGMLCSDCYSIGCCNYCGEYQSESLTPVYDPSHKYIEMDCCEYCAERVAKQRAEKSVTV